MMKEIYFYATPLTDLKDWVKDRTYQIVVAKLWNGKFSIYKQPSKEDPGYRVYPSLETLQEHFSLEKKLVKVADK